MFTSFFRTLGHALLSPKVATEAGIAGAVVGAFNPGMGSFIELIANAAYQVETSMPANTPGSDKKAQVQKIVDVAAPVAVTVLDGIAGKQIDPAAAAPAIDRLIDDLVALMHGLDIFPKHKMNAASAPLLAAAPAASIVKPI